MLILAQPLMAMSLVLYNCVWPSANQHLLKQLPHGRSLLVESLLLGTRFAMWVIFSMVLHVLFVLQVLGIMFHQQVRVRYVLLVTSVPLVACQPQGQSVR